MFKKLFFIIFGVFLAFMVLEAILQTWSIAYSLRKNYLNSASLINKTRSFKILCLGESTTDGQYPMFLKEALNSKKADISFSVIDKGRGGTYTDLILLNLDSYLKKYNPDMVITMMGVNDNRDDVAVLVNTNDMFYANFKIIKLFKLLIYHLKVKFSFIYEICFKSNEITASGNILFKKDTHALPADIILNNDIIESKSLLKTARHGLAKGMFSEAEKMFAKAIALNPKNDLTYCELANLYKSLGKLKDAENIYLKAISFNPKNYNALYNLAGLYIGQGKSKEAEIMYLKTIDANPEYDRPYFSLASLYKHQNRYKELMLISSKLLFYSNPDINIKNLNIKNMRYNYFNNKYYGLTTQFNYNKLKDELKNRNIRHVCVEYPTRDIAPLKEMLGNDKDIIFVDNEKSFKDAVAKDGYYTYFKDKFGGNWGHCTDKGNRMLAENIANAIIKMGLGHK